MKYLQFSSTWCGPCQSLSPIMEQVKSKGLAQRKEKETDPVKIKARLKQIQVRSFLIIIYFILYN